MLGQDALAEAVEQERRLAVQRAAARRLHVGAEQPRGQRRFVQHRHLAGLDLARREARERSFGRVAAHRLRRGELVGRPHRRVPGIALHVVAVLSGQRRDRRDRERMARARVAGAEAARVGGVEMRLLRRHAGAFGVGDAAIDGERRRLAAAGELDRRLGIDRPGMEEIEVASCRRRVGEVGLVGQTRRRILGREAGDVVRGAHRLLERRRREVRRARVAAPLADIDRDADRLVAVALDVLGLALPHRHRQADAFRDLGDCVARAERLGGGEAAVDEGAELVARIGEAGRRRRRSRGGIGHGGEERW